MDFIDIVETYIKILHEERFISEFKKNKNARFSAAENIKPIDNYCLNDCLGMVEYPVKSCLLSNKCPKRIHLGDIKDLVINYEFRSYLNQFYKNKTWAVHLSTCSFHNLIINNRYQFPIIIGNIQRLYKLEIHHFFYSHSDNEVFLAEASFHKTKNYFNESLYIVSKLLDACIFDIVLKFNLLVKLLDGVKYLPSGEKIKPKDLALSFLTCENYIFLEDFVKKLIIINDKISCDMKTIIQIVKQINEQRKQCKVYKTNYNEQKFILNCKQEIMDRKQEFLRHERQNVISKIEPDLLILDNSFKKLLDGTLKHPTGPKLKDKIEIPVEFISNAI